MEESEGEEVTSEGEVEIMRLIERLYQEIVELNLSLSKVQDAIIHLQDTAINHGRLLANQKAENIDDTQKMH